MSALNKYDSLKKQSSDFSIFINPKELIKMSALNKYDSLEQQFIIYFKALASLLEKVRYPFIEYLTIKETSLESDK